MTRMENNRVKYESAEVVAFYARHDALQPAEAYLFARFLQEGMDILDIGVGGGRTTPHLARIARRYIGADYSHAMIETCRARFPGLEFVHCDTTQDMGQFADGTFDAVVFSFNGIDVITTDVGRATCLSDTARILRPGGVFIFSSHNARTLGIVPQLAGAPLQKRAWRILRAIAKSALLCARAPRSAAYRKGAGYVRDTVHGGMDHYVSTPETMVPQLEHAGFEVITRVAGPDPGIRSKALTRWHYYACRKRGEDAG